MDPRQYPRLLEWWRDDPAEPGRSTLEHPDVQRLIAQIAPGSRATDLGGVMSLNVRLEPANLVLRVHQPFVSRQRLLAVQAVRRRLANQGLIVPVPVRWHGATVFPCGQHLAELEEYIPSERPEPTHDSYMQMFCAMGTLHRALTETGMAVPRPVVATYAPPSTLFRWLPVAEGAVRGDSEAEAIARLLRNLVRRLRSQWVTATELPEQLVHGDVRLSNVRRTPEGEPVYFDFGFLACRPRIHDLAYALAWIVLRPDGQGTGEGFSWERVPPLVKAYEETARTTLTKAERRALAPYTAAVPLYQAAIIGFSGDPVETLRDRLRRPFMHISEWLLDHPTALLG